MNTNPNPMNPRSLSIASLRWLSTMTVELTTWATRDAACQTLLCELIDQGLVSPDEPVMLDMTGAVDGVIRFLLPGSSSAFEIDPEFGIVKEL